MNYDVSGRACFACISGYCEEHRKHFTPVFQPSTNPLALATAIMATTATREPTPKNPLAQWYLKVVEGSHTIATPFEVYTAVEYRFAAARTTTTLPQENSRVDLTQSCIHLCTEILAPDKPKGTEWSLVLNYKSIIRLPPHVNRCTIEPGLPLPFFEHAELRGVHECENVTVTGMCIAPDEYKAWCTAARPGPPGGMIAINVNDAKYTIQY